MIKKYEYCIVMAIFILGIMAIKCFFTLVDAYKCHSRWSGSGYEVSYGMIKGCVISKDGQHYIPERNYREME